MREIFTYGSVGGAPGNRCFYRKVEPVTTDRYGRTVAMVLVNGANLSEQIIANGYGWVYRKYCTWSFCNDWLRLEKRARDARIGLWKDKNPVAPWEWRKAKRGGGGSTAKSSKVVQGGAGIYHGNVKSHVFHGSGCQHYNCKNCVKVFRSVNDAIGAGYRAHQQCVKE